jgi:hypothetical protein
MLVLTLDDDVWAGTVVDDKGDERRVTYDRHSGLSMV